MHMTSKTRINKPLAVHNKLATLTLVLIAGFTFCDSTLAQAHVATHCKAGEFAYLNANMSKVQPTQGGGYKLVKTNKVLSVCADKQAEPFQTVAYRYGPVGSVEMEHVANSEKKFSILNRSTSPHTGENLLFFTTGGFTYCVSEATGQGSGIGLTVTKSGKKIADLFSGNAQGVDFESEMIEIDFDVARSAVFKVAKSAPACDAK